MHSRYTFLVSFFLCSVAVVFAGKDSQISMARQFGCSMDHKIEIKDIISQCKCNDDSSCVWTTGRRPVMGCPCPVLPPSTTDYDALKTADIVNCSEKKIEVDKKMGQCDCAEGGQCIFVGRKPLVGCPCAGGRVPTDKDFEEVKSMPHKKKARKVKKTHEDL